MLKGWSSRLKKMIMPCLSQNTQKLETMEMWLHSATSEDATIAIVLQ